MPKSSAKKAAAKVFTPSSFAYMVTTKQPAVDKRLADLEKRNEKHFQPQGVAVCKKGSVYFLPAMGVARCTAKGPMDVAGYKIDKATELTQIYGRSFRNTLPDAKIEKAGVRMLMSESDAENLEKFLKNGVTSVSLPDKNATMAKLQIQSALKSWNPFVLADVVCKVYGKGSTKSQHGGFSYSELGDKALELLAGEYAIVKKIDYDAAIRRLTDIAGKPSLDQLSGYTGTSPYDNISPK